MKKYIHYCWFGNNPLPKLAKQCIESWKKYLPEYEIMCWNESNSELDACPFVKEAYENKKWAFVADYIRAKKMYEYGGIYFDTDMEIIKPIDDLLAQKSGFLGVEDSHLIACGVWYEPKPKSYLAEKMVEFYESQPFFDVDNVYKITIPKVISSILKDFDPSVFENQKLNHNEMIYQRDYFYPLSYNHQYNLFTDNTRMIHYYDASWTPKWEQRENKIYRLFGEKNGYRVINGLRFSKRAIRKCGKIVLLPAIKYKQRKNKITCSYKEKIDETIKNIKKTKYHYIAFSNPDWLGVTNSTKELFANYAPCGELLRKSDVIKVAEKIIECGYTTVVLSGFCLGWKDLAIYLHRKGVNVNTYFHGSHSQVLEPYGWARSLEILELAQKKIVSKMGTCKASLVDFYKQQGCNSYLLTNYVKIPKYKRSRNDDKLVVGIYASKTDIYLKNAFSAIAAASLIKNKDIIIDMVPLTKNAQTFANILGVKIEGITHSLKREELLKRMANCDVLIYTTFSECAPMIPLESFAQNVPCIVGDNCHYFKNEELSKYIVVSEENNPEAIAEKIMFTLENKDTVLKLYQKWDKKNKELSEKLLKQYLEEDNNEK